MGTCNGQCQRGAYSYVLWGTYKRVLAPPPTNDKLVGSFPNVSWKVRLARFQHCLSLLICKTGMIIFPVSQACED